LTAFLAALHYWFPKMFGKMYSERVGLFSAALVFMGFFLTFMPQFLLGNMGMPRRYYSYPDRFQALNVLSTGGAFLLGGGLLLTIGHLVLALKWGRPSPQNPFGSMSYEWLAASPPTKHNFEVTPTIDRGPYDYFRPRTE
jgi:cytochrome c oxidase subunit 1